MYCMCVCVCELALVGLDARSRVHESRNEIMFGSVFLFAIIELGFGLSEHHHR